VIQQLPDATGNSRVVLIYSDNGMKFRTSAMSIPALDPNTARDTKVVLHHLGNDYYLAKIWVQGKDYGYEFPLPDRVKSREKEMSEPVSVAANYSTTQNTDSTVAENTTTSTTTTDNSLNNNNQNQSNTSVNTQQQSQETTPPPPPPDNTMAQNTQPQQATPPPAYTDNSANRSMDENANNNGNTSNDTNTMPRTSAGWLMMLLSGGALSGAGLSLRRKR